MVYLKKAISPVVATALLLVVAVVAVVGFQNWFTTYQSDIDTRVETDSAKVSSLTIERLEADGRVYVKNSARVIVPTSAGKITYALNGSAVSSNCQRNDTLEDIAADGISELTINSSGACALTVGTAYNVVITTSAGLVSSKIVAR